MKLLSKNQKKKITIQEQENLRQQIRQEINQKNLKFNYRNPLLWKIGLFALSFLSIIGGIIYVVVHQVQNGNFEFSETDQIIMGAISFGGIGIAYFAYHEWQKRNRQELKGKFAHFYQIRITAFTNWFNQTYEDAQIVKRLNIHDVRKYVHQLRKTNCWVKEVKIHEIHPGYQIQTKNNVFIDCFIVTIIEKQKNRVIRHNYFSAVITNDNAKWQDFTCRIERGIKNSGKLENISFNKKWGYQSNNKVKLRMLLTPWTQEELVKSKLNFAFVRNQQITYWWGKCNFNNNLFEFKLEVGKTIDQTIDIIVKDIVEDFQNLEFLIKELANYKAFIL